MRSNLLFVVLASCPAACIAPSVVSSEGRAVELTPQARDWRPARVEDLDGLFESTSIEGEAAVALWRIHYHFAVEPGVSGGSYSGAALVLGGLTPQFQTLSGVWRLNEGALEFDGAAATQASVAGDLLRLENEGGTVLLRRAAIQ
ncbi:MAG: hypothetical protein JNN27_06315 [Planctomycetes bacterium]|nr:hypothetical protein [Planctomycetota bacterium]